jgi:four helix bundle protein
MQDFKMLAVWKKAHELTLRTYSLTSNFSREEVYGSTSQMRRTACSIPANNAEGCGRGSSADLARFLQIALGSASELEYHLLLAQDLGYLQLADFERVSSDVFEIKRMLTGLQRRVLTASPNPKLITEN